MMRSLRARLLTGTTAASAVIFIILAAATDQAMRGTLRDEFDAVLLAKTRSLSSMVEIDGEDVVFAFNASQFPEFAAPRAGQGKAGGVTAYFQVWVNGKTFAKSESLGTAELPATAAGDAVAVPMDLPEHRPGRMMVLHFAPFVERSPEGDEHRGPGNAQPWAAKVAVAQSTNEMDHLADRLRWLTLGLCAGAMVLSGCALWWAVSRATQPVRRLAVEIGELHESDLSALDATGLPTELAPVVDRLNALLSRLGEAFARERGFTADVAHELRTPLAGLLATLEVCRSRPRDSEGYETAIDKSLKMLSLMQSLVENLLLLARAEGGQLTLRMAEVNVGELMKECWSLYEARARERGLMVKLELPEVMVARGDREFLRIVFSNLLDNAVSYANEEGSVGVVTVREGSKVMVRISNTGSTLAAAELPRVFERFWRKESARSQTGLHAGLGLSLCRRLMDLQGGELRVTLEGDTFNAVAAMPA